MAESIRICIVLITVLKIGVDALCGCGLEKRLKYKHFIRDFIIFCENFEGGRIGRDVIRDMAR